MIRLAGARIKQLEREIVAMRFDKPEGLPDKYVCYRPEYVGYHSRRFAVMLAALEALGINDQSRLLDVGPTFSSLLLNKHFRCHVDALSFSPDEQTPFGTNYEFDLNKSQYEADWRKIEGEFDAIVFAEVLEHLHTAPSVVLRYLASLVKPGGHILIQTPNALALKARVKLLLGKHPYEAISKDPYSPNHFRENTLDELCQAVREAGLNPVWAQNCNYFNPTFRQETGSNVSSTVGNLYFRMSDLLPPKLKRGLMVIAQKA